MADQDQGSLVADSIAAGVALAEPKAFGIQGGPASVPFIVVPKGYVVETLEKHYPTPYRKRGTNSLSDPASFILFVNDQKSDSTKLYGTVKPAPAFKAVFNDIGAEPGWGDHIATYACPLSTEWSAWIGGNKKPMSQQQFAEFVEENDVDILPPESDRVPTMAEVARSIEATKNAAVSQGVRLDNGQVQFGYSEEINGKVNKGKFDVPEMFQIQIPVFEGGALVTIPVRFRYRVSSGGFSMFYDMVRPHKVLEVATAAVWAEIAAGTGLPIFNGK